MGKLLAFQSQGIRNWGKWLMRQHEDHAKLAAEAAARQSSNAVEPSAIQSEADLDSKQRALLEGIVQRIADGKTDDQK